MGLQRFVAVVATSGALTGLLWTNRERFTLLKVRAKAEYDLDEAIQEYKKGVHKWNRNWDHRAAHSADQTDSRREGKEEGKPRAKRHLFLIRHGQYKTWHKDSKLKKLTELGREQAKETGERLQVLGYDYSILYFSSLPRATETAQLIWFDSLKTQSVIFLVCSCIYSASLPDVPTERCDLIREGAPFPPDPPSRSWRPDYSVSRLPNTLLCVCPYLPSSL